MPDEPLTVTLRAAHSGDRAAADRFLGRVTYVALDATQHPELAIARWALPPNENNDTSPSM
mgnify:CR=1 FL=1